MPNDLNPGEGGLMSGPYIYARVDDLEGAAPVGNKQCAGLVQYYTSVGTTEYWTNGRKVKGNALIIAKGTAVATFVGSEAEGKGYYANAAKDNHAAFYISQTDKGVMVMDQWAGKKTISSRLMRFKGKNKDGSYPDPSNNADALSVIMKSAAVMRPKKAGV
jgi:hypothetical protein